VVDDEELLGLMVEFLSQLVRGTFPPAVRDILVASRLIPLAKDGGGVRPIAVGEVIGRVSSRWWCQELRPQMERLRPLQYCAGVSCGTEMVVRATQRQLALQPEWGALLVDVGNAFNAAERRAIFEGVEREGMPQILPYLRLFYGSPSPLYYQSDTGPHVLQSQRGVRQGDPLGPLLFAVCVQDVLCEVQASLPEGLVLAFADDITITGPLHLLPQAFQQLRDALARHGLSVQPAKCQLYSPAGDVSEDILSRLSGVSHAPDGVVLLGVPLGSEAFVSHHIRQAPTDLTRGLDQVSELDDPQVALALIRQCVVHRSGFLTRTLEPSEEW